ncbi:MAG TPA: hypothetical protein VGM90_25730 [Kofleriaceae bacterium]
MRVEEKGVDGQDLLRAEQKDSLLEREDIELQQGLANERAVDKEGDELLLATMRDIIEKKPVTVRALGLPPRETKALEQLQEAVTGRDVMNTFVFAEDRRSKLDQALAILQPNLSASHSSIVGGLRWDMNHLVSEIHELRVDLRELEDAQEDGLIERMRHPVKTAAPDAPDTTEKPPEADPDAQKPPSSLADGPDVEPEEKTSSMWEDPNPDAVPAQKLRRVDLADDETAEALNPTSKAWWRKQRE